MITIENTKEHDIGINMPHEFLVVPMAREDPEDRKVIINGTVEADEGFIRRAMEAHEVVRFYFDEGWLRVVNPAIEGESVRVDDDDDVTKKPSATSLHRRTKVG